jgi:hypothetical protein
MPIINLYDNNHLGLTASITFNADTGGTYSLGNQVVPYEFDSDTLPGGYYFGTYSLFYSQWGQTCTIQILPPDSPTPTPTNTQTPTQTPTITPTNTETPTNTPTQTPTKTPNQSPDPTQTQTPTPSITPTHTPTQTQTPTNTNTPTNTQTQTQTPTPTTTPASCCAPVITSISHSSICALPTSVSVTINFTIPNCSSPCTGLVYQRSYDNINWTPFGGASCSVTSVSFSLNITGVTYFRLFMSCQNLQQVASQPVTICKICYEYSITNSSNINSNNVTYNDCVTCSTIVELLSPGQTITRCANFTPVGQEIVATPIGNCTNIAACPCDINFYANQLLE